MTEQCGLLRYLIWQQMSHNPEVAGSNPAPATRKAPETGLFHAFTERGGKTFAQLLPAQSMDLNEALSRSDERLDKVGGNGLSGYETHPEVR